ncbi:MAG: hypothetical protein AAGA10_22560 [Bacteroidota bacterium]
MKYIGLLFISLFVFSTAHSQQTATLETGERIYIFPDGSWSRTQIPNRRDFPLYNFDEKVISSTVEDNTLTLRLLVGGQQKIVKEKIDVVGKEQKRLRLEPGTSKEDVVNYKLFRIKIGTEIFEYATLPDDYVGGTVQHLNATKKMLLQQGLDDGGYIAPIFEEKYSIASPQFGQFSLEEAKLVGANMYEMLINGRLRQE